MTQYPLKSRYTYTRLHGVTYQKTAIFTVTAERTTSLNKNVLEFKNLKTLILK